jgi:hypothetical protein
VRINGPHCVKLLGSTYQKKSMSAAGGINYFTYDGGLSKVMNHVASINDKTATAGDFLSVLVKEENSKSKIFKELTIIDLFKYLFIELYDVHTDKNVHAKELRMFGEADVADAEYMMRFATN